jgi:hypothetical protein
MIYQHQTNCIESWDPGPIANECPSNQPTMGAYAAKLMGVHAESPALLMTQWINSNKELTVYFNEVLWRASALEFIVERTEAA